MQPPPPYGFSGHPTLPGGYPPVPPPLPSRRPTIWQRFRSARKRTQWGLGCGTVVLILCLCICSTAAVGASTGSQNATTLAPTATADTSVTQSALVAATTIPTSTPTVVLPPTETPVPTAQPNFQYHSGSERAEVCGARVIGLFALTWHLVVGLRAVAFSYALKWSYSYFRRTDSELPREVFLYRDLFLI